MELSTMYDLLDFAKKNNLVLGAFNTSNLEISLSIVEGAKECGLPVIIQISPSSVELSGYEYIEKIVSVCAKNIDIPICLHLDHGRTIEDIKNAVKYGFKSVMIDCSKFSYEENINLTRQVVEYCHPLGISVEAELGVIQGKEDLEDVNKSSKTDPDLVEEFCQRTGCDLLAVSVGNEHGLKNNVIIDFPILEQISQRCNIPLVIHGGSGIPESTLSKFKNYNVRKVNFSSDLKKTYIGTIGRAYQRNNNEYDIVSVIKDARENMKNVVINKMRALNNL